MKKIAVVLAIAVLVAYAMPVFADDASGAKKVKEKSLFQIFSNEINSSKMPTRFAVKPVAKDTTEAAKYISDKKVGVFQDTAKAIDEQSVKAKNESAR